MNRVRPDGDADPVIYRRWLRLCLCWALLCGGTAGGWVGIEGAEPAADRKPTFEADIAPVLKARCSKCHSGETPRGGLQVGSRRELLRGGDSGPALRIAAAESSLLWEKLASNAMPAEGPPLTAAEKGLFRTWINEGAISEGEPEIGDANPTAIAPQAIQTDHWSYHPPIRPSPPEVGQRGLLRTPIDAFVLAQLESRGLLFAQPADRVVLARRAAFDLTGVPPDPELVREFLSDSREEAWERFVDRLLASPSYGERWGRHWLDLAGYADSAGVLAEDRPIPNAYRYRDYVVRAFNADKPYDRFLQEQLAGDELTGYHEAYATLDRLPEEVLEGVTATGFLRCAPDASRPDFSTIKNADAQYFYPTLNDTLQIVTSSTLGLTVQCARCHSHKYDPIPQADFYRLQAVFMVALRPGEWIPQMERRILIATAAEKKQAEEHNARLDVEILQRRQGEQELVKKFGEQLQADRLAMIPESIRADVFAALQKAPDQRGEVERYLAEKFQPVLRPDEATLRKTLTESVPEFRDQVARLQGEIAGLERQRRHFEDLRALYDLPGPVKTPVLRRGDPLTPGALVEPGVLSAVQAPVAFTWQPPQAGAPTSGRRLAFARWLTQPDHPLTARVFVNRVWLHHFGEGLVSTPEDFGVSGAAPSHPALLDWLAREFVESGWSVKRLHRLILNSSVYRQSSRVDEETLDMGNAVDPENRLLWRQRMRRLEAEAVRDAILAVAGRLEGRMFGAAVPVARQGDGEVTAADPAADRRRSIYMQVVRSQPLTLLQAFDQPVMETNCTRRSRSTVSTQALTLLNSGQLVRAANEFAKRVERESTAGAVEQATWLAWSRRPVEEELQELTAFVESQERLHEAQGAGSNEGHGRALADLCHLLLASNEFVYVD